MKTREPVVEVMDDMVADIMRQKTLQQRLRIVFGMCRSARVLIRGAVTQEHPEWSIDKINHEIARRISHGAVDEDQIYREWQDKLICEHAQTN